MTTSQSSHRPATAAPRRSPAPSSAATLAAQAGRLGAAHRAWPSPSAPRRPDGLRVVLPPRARESRTNCAGLVAVETECCPWAAWAVETERRRHRARRPLHRPRASPPCTACSVPVRPADAPASAGSARPPPAAALPSAARCARRPRCTRDRARRRTARRSRRHRRLCRPAGPWTAPRPPTRPWPDRRG